MALAGCTTPSGSGIDIVDVSGPLDSRALNFISDSIERAAQDGRDLILVQVDSPAVLDGPSFDRLLSLVENPPVPVATWVGPAPANAFGGAVMIVEAASHSAAAPGAYWGLIDPVVLGEARDAPTRPGLSERLPVDQWVGVDAEQPAHFQLLVNLDGETFNTASGPVVVNTLENPDDPLSIKQVRFIKPGLVDRFFRLAVVPEAAFFFFVVGITVIIFEFYALGPGLAAAVGAVSLLLGGWGLAVLPTRPWAVAMTLFGFVALTWAYQRGRSVVATTVGTLLLFFGGVYLVDGQGQIDPRWWLILLSVLAVLFFYLLAMPTVQRARLSTMTIGREGLIGTEGVALGDFSPDGFAEVSGGRWRATAHREAKLVEGDRVVVTGVDGLYLEVEPADSDRET